MFPFGRHLWGNLIDDLWLQTVSNIKHIHPKVGCRRRDYFSARGELTLLQLGLQVNPHRSVEVGGDGEEVGNVLICKGHTTAVHSLPPAPAWGELRSA